MATLTGKRPDQRRSHLKRTAANDDGRPMMVGPTGKVRSVDDPTPGPRDASALVARFSRVLPRDVDVDGVFSLGGD